jgi:dipeptidyl aminopeptidase/acylaminoacyl peptidase
MAESIFLGGTPESHAFPAGDDEFARAPPNRATGDSPRRSEVVTIMSRVQRVVSVAVYAAVLSIFCVAWILPGASAAEVFSVDDVENVQRVYSARISPDGEWIAYTMRVAREPDDDPGYAYVELHVLSTKTGVGRPYVAGKVNVGDVRWSPDGSRITFRMRRPDSGETQVWAIPLNGGEAYPITDSMTSVIDYEWDPTGGRIAYIATTPKSAVQTALEKKGYGFDFYEEDLRPRNLYLVELDEKGKAAGEPVKLTTNVTVWTFTFGPKGRKIAASISPENLIDQRYMFRKVYLLDVETKTLEQVTDNPGKLGNFAFSPDGSKLAYTAARSRRDHNVSQAYVMDLEGGEPVNLTPPNFPGHIEWVDWKDGDEVVYFAGEGVWNTLSTVKASGGKRKVILHSRESGVVYGVPTFAKDFKHFAMVGESPTIPGDVFYWKGKGDPKRLTTLNPWIAERELGRQEIIHYAARDGLEIEALVVYPVGYQEGTRYPLVVSVHGGPESHYSNEWLTSYYTPAQALAGMGYALFYPNYRSSTGYGPDFTKDHLGDPAGKEFDDIADGIRHLIDQGIADPERVGLGGGSYGGYAAAWFSSYYTDLVKAAVMFVGVSDLISKRSTTDIPYEEWYVHSGAKLEDMWDLSLERSPVYYAHQSKTAVLILGGMIDTRVHPSQSLEYYRRLKMNDHPAVRYVRYPGEGHGNRKQPGRIDVLHRVVEWYDWYVKEGNPIDGPMPRLDISDTYGLDLPEPLEGIEAETGDMEEDSE